MKIKKIIALFTSIVMIIGLVACGNTDSGKGSASGEYDWSKGADASGGDVKLRVATWRKSDQAYYEEIVKRFEEKYDWIDVELEINQDTSSYYSNLQADLIGGTAPDVFDSHPTDKLVTYAEEGLIAPQTDFDYMKNYSEEAQLVTNFLGENYGFLFTYNYFGFLYNKTIFEEVGVSVPATPDELIDVVNKLKAAGYGGAIFAGATWNTVNGIISAILLNSMGTEGYADLREGMDNGTITDVSTVKGVPEALKTLQAYKENDIFYNAFEGISYEAGMSLYAQEKSALVYSGSYIFGEKENYFPDIDTGYFPVPTYADTKLTYAEGGQTTCINAASENLGAAKLWVEFMATPEISEYYCSNARMLSTIKGVTPTFEEAEMLMNASEDYGITEIMEPENAEYWGSSWSKVLEGVFYDGENWEDLVRTFTSKLEEYDLANLE